MTVGAFYSRFADKDALLEELEHRIVSGSNRVFERLGGMRETSKEKRELLLREAIAAAIAFSREHSGVLRALFERSQSDPALRKRVRQFNKRNIAVFLNLVNPRDVHNTASELGVLVAAGAVREAIVYRHFWTLESLTDSELAERIARMLTAYWRAEGV
jgi:AcrR family transcriptional regulator